MSVFYDEREDISLGKSVVPNRSAAAATEHCSRNNATFRHRFQASLLFSAFLSSAVAAQEVAQVNCGIALRESAIDSTNVSVGIDLINDLKRDICDRSFESEEAAAQYARSGGVTFGMFDFFDFGVSDNKSRLRTNYNVKDSVFCSETARNIAAKSNIGFNERVGRFALQAFERCVELTQSSGLWMTYDVIERGRILRATMTRKSDATTPLSYNITDLDIQALDGATVNCSIDQDRIIEGEPINVNAGTARFTCVKEGDGAAVIDLRTDVTEFTLTMPSSATIHDDNVTERQSEVDARLTALSNRLDQATTWNASGIFAQVQAQAICTSMVKTEEGSDQSGYVFAVPRQCNDTSLNCNQICSTVSARGVDETIANRVATNTLEPATLGAVHIYSRNPTSNQESTGLMTFTYAQGSLDRSFCGPNYCCCTLRNKR